jgi:hypothetical protein
MTRTHGHALAFLENWTGPECSAADKTWPQGKILPMRVLILPRFRTIRVPISPSGHCLSQRHRTRDCGAPFLDRSATASAICRIQNVQRLHRPIARGDCRSPQRWFPPTAVRAWKSVVKPMTLCGLQMAALVLNDEPTLATNAACQDDCFRGIEARVAGWPSAEDTGERERLSSNRVTAAEITLIEPAERHRGRSPGASLRGVGLATAALQQPLHHAS